MGKQIFRHLIDTTPPFPPPRLSTPNARHLDNLPHPERETARRNVPVGVMDGVRALLNIGSTEEGKNEKEDRRGGHLVMPSLPTPAPLPGTTGVFTPATPVPSIVDPATAAAADSGEETACATSSTVAVATSGCGGPTTDRSKTKFSTGNVCQSTRGISSAIENLDDDVDGDDDTEGGADPWGEGVGESRWGRGTGLNLVDALGSWCASVSSYDRLARPTPESAAGLAAEAEVEWEELERRIARGRLDVQLEEFR